MSIQVRAQIHPWGKAVGLLVHSGNCVAEPLILKEIGEMEVPRETVSLSPEAAQTLMDDLWQCGLRPTEGSGSAGALAATQRHLEDMRTLVFKSAESNGAREGGA